MVPNPRVSRVLRPRRTTASFTVVMVERAALAAEFAARRERPVRAWSRLTTSMRLSKVESGSATEWPRYR